MTANTIRLHRVLRATPEKIYKAFLDPDAMAKWLPPNGFTAKVNKMDAKVGGTHKMSFTNFTTGKSHSFGGTYVELTPHERIRYTDKFDDPNLPGEMQTTITLKKVSCGTELNIVQEGVPDVIPAEACYLGWQESLTLLAKLVEAEFQIKRSIQEKFPMQKITPFLWFNDNAEDAVKFYASIFKDSKIGRIARYGEEAAQKTGRPKGSVMTVEFELEGQQFVGLNGGPMFKFTDAVSFVVNCETQEEVDYFWSKLSAGGEESRCGWLKDKFGLSWQVVPVVLIEMLTDKDTAKAKRVMHAMLQMDKIDIAVLKKAYDQNSSVIR